MKTFRPTRKTVQFQYEFEDGSAAVFEYAEETTAQTKENFDVKTPQELYAWVEGVLLSNIRGVDGADVGRLIEDQSRNGSLIRLKRSLDQEVGNAQESLQSAS